MLTKVFTHQIPDHTRQLTSCKPAEVTFAFMLHHFTLTRTEIQYFPGYQRVQKTTDNFLMHFGLHTVLLHLSPETLAQLTHPDFSKAALSELEVKAEGLSRDLPGILG